YWTAPARAAPRLLGCSCGGARSGHVWVRKSTAKIFVDSGSCTVETEKTGQVLVRTCSTERRHPAGRIALSAAPNRAHRPGERPRHVRLLGQARLHQEHARIGLGDQVLRSSGHDDHALIRFGPWAVARIDDHGLGRRKGERSAKACGPCGPKKP